MNQQEKAKQFAKLHKKGNPIVIYNAWDAGSAKNIVEAGAQAIGTSSWAVAAAQGYKDGENIPLELLQRIAERVIQTVDVPVTVDFEGGFAGNNNDELFENITRLIQLGAIGINFEDQIVKGDGLYEIDSQARRIEVVRNAAKKASVDLFINARTDVFFEGGESQETVTDAIVRAKAYAAAGASGLFVPGLTDEAFIKQICDNTDLAVNVMVDDDLPAFNRLAELGVSRISYGIIPYVSAMENLQQNAVKEFKLNA